MRKLFFKLGNLLLQRAYFLFARLELLTSLVSRGHVFAYLQTDIVGATINQKVWRQLSLSWGVKPVLCQLKDNTDELFDHAVDVTVKAGAAKKGDTVVITAGIPLGMSGTTNMLKVHKING